MKIQLNGSPIATHARTLAELLHEQQIDAGSIASALNGQFVPRSQYGLYPLTEGCELEVLAPMQGG